jgi:hypothetical protein
MQGVVELLREARRGASFALALPDGRRYGETLERATAEAWIAAQARAFEALGGVPARVRIARVPASLRDPRSRAALEEFADHFGFVWDEGERVSPGGLRPLPAAPFEPSIFRRARLHPDCHVFFGGAYYSAPCRLIGRTLLVRGRPDRVEILDGPERVAAHPRAAQPGERRSRPSHYPDPGLARLLPAPRRICHDARLLGPATGRLVAALVDERPVDGLRGAQGVVHLARRYGRSRLEAACAWALRAGQRSYRAVAYVLRKGLDRKSGGRHGIHRSSESA